MLSSSGKKDPSGGEVCCGVDRPVTVSSSLRGASPHEPDAVALQSNPVFGSLFIDSSGTGLAHHGQNAEKQPAAGGLEGLVNPADLLQSLLDKGVELRLAGDLLGKYLSCYQARCALLTPSSQESSSFTSSDTGTASTRSERRRARSAEHRKACEEMADKTGYCYLRVVKLTRRSYIMGKLGANPTIYDFLATVLYDDIDWSRATETELVCVDERIGGSRFHMVQGPSRGGLKFVDVVDNMSMSFGDRLVRRTSDIAGIDRRKELPPPLMMAVVDRVGYEYEEDYVAGILDHLDGAAEGLIIVNSQLVGYGCPWQRDSSLALDDRRFSMSHGKHEVDLGEGAGSGEVTVPAGTHVTLLAGTFLWLVQGVKCGWTDASVDVFFRKTVRVKFEAPSVSGRTLISYLVDGSASDEYTGDMQIGPGVANAAEQPAVSVVSYYDFDVRGKPGLEVPGYTVDKRGTHVYDGASKVSGLPFFVPGRKTDMAVVHEMGPEHVATLGFGHALTVTSAAARLMASGVGLALGAGNTIDVLDAQSSRLQFCVTPWRDTEGLAFKSRLPSWRVSELGTRFGFCVSQTSAACYPLSERSLVERPGFCYLLLFAPEERKRLAEDLGPCLTWGQLVSAFFSYKVAWSSLSQWGLLKDPGSGSTWHVADFAHGHVDAKMLVTSCYWAWKNDRAGLSDVLMKFGIAEGERVG